MLIYKEDDPRVSGFIEEIAEYRNGLTSAEISAWGVPGVPADQGGLNAYVAWYDGLDQAAIAAGAYSGGGGGNPPPRPGGG